MFLAQGVSEHGFSRLLWGMLSGRAEAGLSRARYRKCTNLRRPIRARIGIVMEAYSPLSIEEQAPAWCGHEAGQC